MKKILITWAKGMLASDFIRLYGNNYDLILTDYKELDITDVNAIEKSIIESKPDMILNFAAYTNVDDAEDVGMKMNFDVNTLWVYNLASISENYDIDFITISTDYVFWWDKQEWYKENDSITEPVNTYGMAKYLAEKIALQQNNKSIIIRTSWLYGGGKDFKNFVNTMMSLATKLDSLKVVDDQFGNPTYAGHLAESLDSLIQNISTYRWSILHLSNSTEGKGVSWYEFAQKIFELSNIQVELTPCDTSGFLTKAKRPQYSKLLNTSKIQLPDWKKWLQDYLHSLS